MKDRKKLLTNSTFIFIAIALIIVAFSAYDFINRDIVPINTYPEGSIMLVRKYRLYPNDITIVIYKNGNVKKARREDHYTEGLADKEKFELVHVLSDTEKTELNMIIESLPSNRTYDGGIDSRGIQIIPALSATDLKDASEYNQETVDKILDFINKVS
jgi:hypothetical protein